MSFWKCMSFLNNKIVVSVNDFPFYLAVPIDLVPPRLVHPEHFQFFIFFTDIMSRLNVWEGAVIRMPISISYMEHPAMSGA